MAVIIKIDQNMKGVCYCLSRLHESGLLLLGLLLLINIEDLILQVNSDRTKGFEKWLYECDW